MWGVPLSVVTETITRAMTGPRVALGPMALIVRSHDCGWAGRSWNLEVGWVLGRAVAFLPGR